MKEAIFPMLVCTVCRRTTSVHGSFEVSAPPSWNRWGRQSLFLTERPGGDGGIRAQKMSENVKPLARSSVLSGAGQEGHRGACQAWKTSVASFCKWWWCPWCLSDAFLIFHNMCTSSRLSEDDWWWDFLAKILDEHTSDFVTDTLKKDRGRTQKFLIHPIVRVLFETAHFKQMFYS